jgi:C4-dicarboxylate transporter DctM subunit
MTIALILLLLLVLILIGVPVSFAILATGIVGLITIGGVELVDGVTQFAPASSVMSYSLSAAPLFILMANLILKSGLVDHLFTAARVIVGRAKGGTGVASVTAGAIFAAVSGSSTASAATLGQTSTVKMIEEGYAPKTASGLVAVVGTLAAMIPPSIILVFYAVTADVGVGDVLIAGIVPGLIIAAVLIITMYLTGLSRTAAMPSGIQTPIREKLGAAVNALPVLALFAVVIGLVFFGVATPTESAAIGCLAAFALLCIRRKASIQNIVAALAESTKTSAMILAIIIGAEVFGHFLVETRVAPNLVEWMSGLPFSPFVIMIIVALFYVILGFFLDQIAILALTVPVVLPLIEQFGYDPVWFGVFIVLLAEIGLVTPPMGLNAFVVARSANRPVGEVFIGAVPYIIAMLIVALAFLVWPEIILWFPTFMK